MNNRKKVLILASVASMIDQFNMPNIKLLLDMGYEVHVACNFIEGSTCSDEQIGKLKNTLESLDVNYYQIDFKRNVMNIQNNIVAYKQVLSLMKKNKYEFAHCHSPIGGVIGRLTGKATKTKIIYTAHGFHFFKGAPLVNWLIYYPIERWLARYTDILITINKEDYERAKGFKAKRVEYVPGVGIDIDKFNAVKVDKVLKRKELGLPEDSFVVLSVGELNKNKNHEVIIKAIAQLNDPTIHYVICGQGGLEGYLRDLSIELGVENQVHLLGFRKDIPEICRLSDVFVFPSLREGLGLAALEAMAAGLPIITSNVHGIVDYSANEVTGYSYNPKDVEGFTKAIRRLKNKKLRNTMGNHNINVVRKFAAQNVIKDVHMIYELLGGNIYE